MNTYEIIGNAASVKVIGKLVSANKVDATAITEGTGYRIMFYSNQGMCMINGFVSGSKIFVKSIVAGSFDYSWAI